MTLSDIRPDKNGNVRKLREKCEVLACFETPICAKEL